MPFTMAAGSATAAAVTADIALAGVGTQMYGQYQVGRAAEAQGKSQQAWHEYNAQLAEREAIETRESAAYEESKHRKAGERLKAKQRAGYAKAGVTFEGSPLEVMEETASELEMDALMIRRSGQVGAQRLTAEAQLSRFAGRSTLLRGKAKRRASYYGMASTGLTGAAQTGYQYGSMTGKW